MNTPQKISPHFYYHEFFSSGMWYNYHEVFLKKLLDERVVLLAEAIRINLNSPMYINNWYWGGNSMYRGFRPATTQVGATYSQHKMGRALDFKMRDFTPNQIREHILDNQDQYMKLGLTRIEDGRDATTWVHFDLAWTGREEIYVFRD